MKNASKAIENYIFGKDGNRPDLLRHAFSQDASLNVIVQTSSILFPPCVHGREAIAEVLVRSFSRMRPAKSSTQPRKAKTWCALEF